MNERMAAPFEPDWAVPPGETLEETIDALGMSQVELAHRAGLTPKTINQIVKGKAPVTPATALALEKVTEIPARFWNNLERDYQEGRAKSAERERLEAEIDMLAQVPVAQLVKRGVIAGTKDKAEQLRRVLTFFGVADRASWEDKWLTFDAGFRQSKASKADPGASAAWLRMGEIEAKKPKVDPGALAAWLRIGEIEAKKMKCEPFSGRGFRSALRDIRGMTLLDPEDYAPRMVERCAMNGVALVFVPEIAGARAWGACRWLAPAKAMIQLSLRYKWEDHFWFSFYHEAGHLLLHGKRVTFIESGGGDSKLESEADRFAGRFLIPRNHEKELNRLTALAGIQAFAARIGVHPGIVVGRLQHEGVIHYGKGNRLRRKLAFEEQNAR